MRRIIDRLLAEQLPDGGWNCEAANGSMRSSFNTTICVLEALLELEPSGAATREMTPARLRGRNCPFSSADSFDDSLPAR